MWISINSPLSCTLRHNREKDPWQNQTHHTAEIRKKKNKNGLVFYNKFQILCKCILAFIRDCSIMKGSWLFINTWTHSLLRPTCRRPESVYLVIFISSLIKLTSGLKIKTKPSYLSKTGHKCFISLSRKKGIKTIACMWSLKCKKTPRAFGKKPQKSSGRSCLLIQNRTQTSLCCLLVCFPSSFLPFIPNFSFPFCSILQLESLSCPFNLPSNFLFTCTHFQISNVLIALYNLFPYTYHTRASPVQGAHPSLCR